LKEEDAGAATAEICRRHGISPSMFYNWKPRFGGRGVSECTPESSLNAEAPQLPITD
jgi:putative transposase